MLKNKLAISSLNQQSQFEMNNNIRMSKITMSAAGKNQHLNNERWTKIIRHYHNYLVCH